MSRSHGALPGTTGLPPLDSLLEGAGLLCDALSAHPRVDAEAGQTVAWSWRQELVGDAIRRSGDRWPMRVAAMSKRRDRHALKFFLQVKRKKW